MLQETEPAQADPGSSPSSGATVSRVGTSSGGMRASVLSAAAAIASIINFSYTLSMTRRLSTREFAVFAAGQSLLLVAGTVAVAAVPWVLAQEVVRAEGRLSRERRAVRFALWVNVLLGAVLGAGVALVALSFTGLAIAGLLGFTTLLLVVGSTGTGFLQGQRRFGLLGTLGLGEFAVKALVGVLLVFGAGFGVGAALGAATIGAAVLVVGGLWVMRDRLGPPALLTADPGLWRAALRIGAVQILVAAIAASDTVIVAVLPATRGHAAAYQAAAVIGKIPLTLSAAISAAVFPLLAIRARDVTARAHALRSYLLLSAYVCVVLATVPAGLLHAVFPASFAGLRTWLPVTALLGTAIGLINLITTFGQAQQRVGNYLIRLAAGLGLVVVGLTIGGEAGGVQGLAWGAVAGSWVAVGLLGVLSVERAAIWRVATGGSAAVAAAALAALWLVLKMCSASGPWLVLLLVTGTAALVGAFPELRPLALRLAGGDRWTPTGAHRRSNAH